MDITPEEVEDKPKLEVNKTLDIFLETKEVEVRVGCTYRELYEVLMKEWGIIRQLTGNSEPIPFAYNDDLKLFTFSNGWKFKDGSLKYMQEGSFSRYDKNGRSV
jgi:hypothetical protein